MELFSRMGNSNCSSNFWSHWSQLNVYCFVPIESLNNNDLWGRYCFHRRVIHSVHRSGVCGLPLPRMHHWSHDQGGRGVCLFPECITGHMTREGCLPLSQNASLVRRGVSGQRWWVSIRGGWMSIRGGG